MMKRILNAFRTGTSNIHEQSNTKPRATRRVLSEEEVDEILRDLAVKYANK